MVKSFKQFKNRNVFEKEVFYSFMETFFNSDLLSDGERILLERHFIDPQHLIKENFFDTLKSRYGKAKLVANDVSQSAKDSLEKLVSAAKTATDFVMQIKRLIATQVPIILTKTKDKIKSKLKADKKFLDAIKDKVSSDRSAFIKDLSTCKTVVKFYKEELSTQLTNQIVTGMSKFMSDSNVSEKLLLIKESGNVISNLVHKINTIPPFSWIDRLQKIGTQGAEVIIEQLSIITGKLGGQEFTLPIIAIILGIAFEYNMKGLAKHGLLDMVSMYSLPFIAPIIKMVGLIATIIAAYELMVAIVSGVKGEDELHDYRISHPTHHITKH